MPHFFRPVGAGARLAWKLPCRGVEADVNERIEAGFWRDVIGAEYDSLPRLSLTLAQAQRLWGIDEAMARRVLASYLETGYLTLTADGLYRRTDAVPAATRSHRA